MAKVYLDANKFIDLARRRDGWVDLRDGLVNYDIYTSVLNLHILGYVLKAKIDKLFDIVLEITNECDLLDFDKSIAELAFQGPTSDYEDNIQLHSAVKADCDIFLTSDRTLIKTAFFGKMRIMDGM